MSQVRLSGRLNMKANIRKRAVKVIFVGGVVGFIMDASGLRNPKMRNDTLVTL